MDSTNDKVDDTDSSSKFDSIVGIDCWLDSAFKDELYSLVDDSLVHSGQWVIITVVSNVAVSVKTIIDPFSVVELVIVASQFVSWLVIDVDKTVVIGVAEEMVVLDVVVTGNDDDNKLENWSVVDSSVDELGS